MLGESIFLSCKIYGNIRSQVHHQESNERLTKNVCKSFKNIQVFVHSLDDNSQTSIT